jgi:predicted MPP superfamily phosphohydrolase
MQPFLIEPLKVETLDLAIADLPSHLHGTKIAQLSDFHYDGERLSNELLMQAIEQTNRSDPDFVVLTGDFVTDDPSPIHELVSHLKHLRCSSGVYAILGNHDLHRRKSKATIAEALSKIDIRVLWNEVVYPVGEGLALVGLADLWSPDYKHAAAVMNQLPETLPRIVLAHNPDCAEPLQEWRVDLQLSGHSHGGQVIVPIVGNISVICAELYRYLPRKIGGRVNVLRACFHVLKHWEWVQGFHHVGKNRLYVNRGLGTYFPGRLFCPPEVTVITLFRKPT